MNPTECRTFTSDTSDEIAARSTVGGKAQGVSGRMLGPNSGRAWCAVVR